MNKKYFSIQDVAQLTGISASKLRYAEKVVEGFAVHKIRNRRYYSIDDIARLLSYGKFNISMEEFKSKLEEHSRANQTSTKPAASIVKAKATSIKENNQGALTAHAMSDSNPDIINEIDLLLSKFHNIVEKSAN